MNTTRRIRDESPAGDPTTLPAGISSIVVVGIEEVVVLVIGVEVVLVLVLDVVVIVLVVELEDVVEVVVELEEVVVLVMAAVASTSISTYLWGGLYPRALILSL